MKVNRSTLPNRILFVSAILIGIGAVTWLLFVRNPKADVNNSQSAETVTEPLTSPPLESFVGTYINSNPAPDRLDKIEIVPLVGNRFQVYMWGTNSSTQDYTGNPVQVIIDNSFLVRHITLMLNGNSLHVITANSYLAEESEKQEIIEDDFTKIDTFNPQATSTPIPIKFPPFIPGITPSDVKSSLERLGMLCDTETHGESNGEEYYYWKCEKQEQSVQFFATFYSRNLLTVDYIDVNVLHSDETSKNIVLSFLATAATIPFLGSEEKQTRATVWVEETLPTLTREPDDFRSTNIDGVVIQLIGGAILRIGEIP